MNIIKEEGENMKIPMAREFINKVHLRKINDRIIFINKEISTAASSEKIGKLLDELMILQTRKKKFNT